MESLHIDTGVKRIMVNDDPDNVIEFSPGDISFAERFYALIREFEVKQIDYQARAAVIDANKELDANGIPLNMAAGLAMMREVCEFMRDKIDGLFGKDTSRKCFGDALSLDAFSQFFTQITPFIRSARAGKIAPYTNTVTDKKRKHAVMK